MKLPDQISEEQVGDARIAAVFFTLSLIMATDVIVLFSVGIIPLALATILPLIFSLIGTIAFVLSAIMGRNWSDN